MNNRQSIPNNDAYYQTQTDSLAMMGSTPALLSENFNEEEPP